MHNYWLKTMKELYGKDYVDQLVRNQYSAGMTDNNDDTQVNLNSAEIFAEHKQPNRTELVKVRIGDDVFTTFGVIKEVGENDRYLWMKNEHGGVVQKAKSYVSWSNTKAKANRLMDRPVVIRTGVGWRPQDWFSDLHLDANRSILTVPADAGKWAAATLVKERIRAAHLDYYNDLRIERLENQTAAEIEEQQEEIRRLQEEREQLTPTEKGELDQAIRDLDNAFPDLVGSPREFVITGNAYTKTLGHVDKSFALRLGIDVTKKKRIKVNVLERLRSNYVGLELTDHKDMYCEAALKISNHRDTKGQWVIASVNPGVKDWHKYEKTVAPNGGKDMQKPVSWFLEANAKIKTLMLF